MSTRSQVSRADSAPFSNVPYERDRFAANIPYEKQAALIIDHHQDRSFDNKLEAIYFYFSRPNSRAVLSSRLPVTFKFFDFCKARIASCVVLFITPSTGPEYKPLSFSACCAFLV